MLLTIGKGNHWYNGMEEGCCCKLLVIFHGADIQQSRCVELYIVTSSCEQTTCPGPAGIRPATTYHNPCSLLLLTSLIDGFEQAIQLYIDKVMPPSILSVLSSNDVFL